MHMGTKFQDGRDRLGAWRHALLRYVRSGHPDLTNRQMALLLVVGREGGLHTVRGLAARLGVSKPVVTRALNSLTAYDMVARRVDERDRRSVFIDLTPAGEEFLGAFEALLVDDSDDLDGADVLRPRARAAAAA
jgi:DNA-binding MarR family transcriptional regulator